MRVFAHLLSVTGPGSGIKLIQSSINAVFSFGVKTGFAFGNVAKHIGIYSVLAGKAVKHLVYLFT